MVQMFYKYVGVNIKDYVI